MNATFLDDVRGGDRNSAIAAIAAAELRFAALEGSLGTERIVDREVVRDSFLFRLVAEIDVYTPFGRAIRQSFNTKDMDILGSAANRIADCQLHGILSDILPTAQYPATETQVVELYAM